MIVCERHYPKTDALTGLLKNPAVERTTEELALRSAVEGLRTYMLFTKKEDLNSNTQYNLLATIDRLFQTTSFAGYFGSEEDENAIYREFKNEIMDSILLEGKTKHEFTFNEPCPAYELQNASQDTVQRQLPDPLLERTPSEGTPPGKPKRKSVASGAVKVVKGVALAPAIIATGALGLGLGVAGGAIGLTQGILGGISTGALQGSQAMAKVASESAKYPFKDGNNIAEKTAKTVGTIPSTALAGGLSVGFGAAGLATGTVDLILKPLSKGTLEGSKQLFRVAGDMARNVTS
ncbi:hypothetical protein FRB99_001592 [Tulasnella sp. 403]|nr:hypothetical protein FRB99_001592 [Tulasnella sp. 403]